MREGIGGAIFARFQAAQAEYREYCHSPATIAGIAAEGVIAWLEELGLEPVKDGEAPPWMEPVGLGSCDGCSISVYTDAKGPYSADEYPANGCDYETDTVRHSGLYRLRREDPE